MQNLAVTSRPKSLTRFLLVCSPTPYFATRILLQNGFKAKNVSGGMLSLAHNFLLEPNKEEG
jgi:hypothetical protein